MATIEAAWPDEPAVVEPAPPSVTGPVEWLTSLRPVDYDRAMRFMQQRVDAIAAGRGAEAPRPEKQ